MDPDANWAEQAGLLSRRKLDACDRRRLLELRRALQGWLTSGGFPPRWSAQPDSVFAAWAAWAQEDR